VIEECVTIALQAPVAGNRQKLYFVVVTDKQKRALLAEVYRKGAGDYIKQALASLERGSGDPVLDATMRRSVDSGSYLINRIHQVPVHVIPCIYGRTEGQDVRVQSARWGSIIPAAWSFMLAGRARGLGMTFTSFHLSYEEEAATLLGIPYKEIMQAGLLPVAYYKGTEFRPASRPPFAQVIHWDGW